MQLPNINIAALLRCKRVWLFIALISSVLLTINNDRFKAFIDVLTPPELSPVDYDNQQVHLKQNWSKSDINRFSHISQGTSTLPIPLEWFMALEAPNNSPLGSVFFENPLFTADDYLLRHGFIKASQSPANPYGLPVGLAITEYQHLQGLEHSVTSVGFTCAGCHTARITHNDTDYIIEGGPASFDLPLLTKTLGSALAQTVFSSKLPVFDGRFDRFAKRVLKHNYSPATKIELATQLENVAKAQAAQPGDIAVQEGFARLDALNRIGNQVFAFGPKRYENYVAINAPVAYPHLWTVSWFDWVQYDGSIMQPLIRNSGEALGVQAAVNYDAPAGQQRYSSSVPVNNLNWIETALGGEKNPLTAKKFGGLQAPAWPFGLSSAEDQLQHEGKKLYAAHCQKCHLPPLDSEQIWNNFKPIEYYTADGTRQFTAESYLKLNIIPLDEIGTDPAQARVLAERTVSTSGRVNNQTSQTVSEKQALGLDTEVCLAVEVPDPNYPESGEYKYKNKDTLMPVRVTDGPQLNFALALGATVQQVNDQWFAANAVTDKEQQEKLEGNRPNCLQAGAGYKARPLNGIWATAPYLHNGSVASIEDLLMPAEQRPRFVQLGSTEIDIESIGIKQDPALNDALEKNGPEHSFYRQGRFIVDTRLPGNSNRGHEFSADYQSEGKSQTGIIGPALNKQQRTALLAYIKTL